MTRTRTIVGIIACCALLGACASRPSTDELTEAILTATNASGSTVSISNETAACIAQRLLDSDLSDTTLSGLAENFDNPQVLETEADQVEPTVAAAALDCQSATATTTASTAAPLPTVAADATTASSAP